MACLSLQYASAEAGEMQTRAPAKVPSSARTALKKSTSTSVRGQM